MTGARSIALSAIGLWAVQALTRLIARELIPMSEQSTDDIEHQSGFRKGPRDTCDHDGCDSHQFGLVQDELTDKRLVVCESCGFTMGVLDP